MSFDWSEPFKYVAGAAAWQVIRSTYSRFFPSPGPAPMLSPDNLRCQGRVYPAALKFENAGKDAACDIRWEIRRYYDELFPPTYDRRSKSQLGSLQPREELVVEVLDDEGKPGAPGTQDLSVADLCTFEILVHYRDLHGRPYLSHVKLGMAGKVLGTRHCVGWVGRKLLPVHMWRRHTLESLCAKLRCRR